MYTLLLPGRSHIVNDEMASRIIAALENDRAVETILVEMNGEGSGEWEVVINVRQVIALVKHPSTRSQHEAAVSGLRLVPS